MSIFNSQVTQNIWLLAVDVEIQRQKMRIGALYRSHNNRLSTFFDVFEEWVEQHFSIDHTNIIAGDFNIDVSNTHTIVKKLRI